MTFADIDSGQSPISSRSMALMLAGSIMIIIFAIVITQMVTSMNATSFSQIITVGPIWSTNAWQCTSDSNFLVHVVLRGLEGAQFSIGVSNTGEQSLLTFQYAGQTESFTIGAIENQKITITRAGTVSGIITLQTMSGAEASCVEV